MVEIIFIHLKITYTQKVGLIFKNNQYFRNLSQSNIKIYHFIILNIFSLSAFMTPVYFYNFKNIYEPKSELIKKALREHGLIKSNFDLISSSG